MIREKHQGAADGERTQWYSVGWYVWDLLSLLQNLSGHFGGISWNSMDFYEILDFQGPEGSDGPSGRRRNPKNRLGAVEMLENAQEMYSEVFYAHPGPSLESRFLRK